MKAVSSNREHTMSCWHSVVNMPIFMSGSCWKKSWRLRRCQKHTKSFDQKGMSTAVKQFHEEEAIGKTYDFQIARRLLRYLKPYLRLLIPALLLTLALNLLGVLQPKFTQYAIDWHIIPRKSSGLMLLVWLF